MERDRIISFIESMQGEKNALLVSLRREALSNRVPILREDTENFMVFLMQKEKPKKILEIGTGSGYSGSVMLFSNPEAVLTTLEDYPKRIEMAKKTFADLGLEERVTLIPEDATDALKNLQEPFDFIFLDAAKAQYIRWLPDLVRLLKKDGILLADNIWQDGDILESRYLVRRRDRTIHERIREFLYEIHHNENLKSVILNVGDGISISLKVTGEK